MRYEPWKSNAGRPKAFAILSPPNRDTGITYSRVQIGNISKSRREKPRLSASYQRPKNSTARLAFQSLEIT